MWGTGEVGEGRERERGELRGRGRVQRVGGGKGRGNKTGGEEGKGGREVSGSRSMGMEHRIGLGTRVLWAPRFREEPRTWRKQHSRSAAGSFQGLGRSYS